MNTLIELLNAEKTKLETKIPKNEPRPRQEPIRWEDAKLQKLRETLRAFNTVLDYLKIP